MGKLSEPNCKTFAQECHVSSVVEASELLRAIAGYGEPGEATKSALRRVQNRLHGWNPHRLYSIWRKSDRVRLTADELNELRRVAGRKKAEINERTELLARIERLEAALLAKDPAHYRSEIDVLKRVAGGMGGEG